MAGETTSDGQLADRIALVTGASRGIGAAVARRYAKEGAHVILVATTQGALEEVHDQITEAGGKATLRPLDLTQFDQIDQMGAAIFERFGRLDILVGNAAVLGTTGPLAHAQAADWERTMAVNLTANWRLLRSMDPLLRMSDAGRAIFVTSAVGQRVQPYFGAYSISKAGLDMMVRIYAAENANTRIRANILDPKRTRTRMRAEAFPGEDPMTVKTPDALSDFFVELALPSCQLNGEIVAGPEG